jgi:quinol monooxygenase YgiN
LLLIAGSVRIDAAVRDDLIETAIEIVRALRKQVGCTQVSLSADLEDPSVLHLFQTWESQAALMANLGLPQIEAIRDHVGQARSARDDDLEVRDRVGWYDRLTVRRYACSSSRES